VLPYLRLLDDGVLCLGSSGLEGSCCDILSIRMSVEPPRLQNSIDAVSMLAITHWSWPCAYTVLEMLRFGDVE